MNKINHILQQWPSGTAVTSKWLRENGVYKQLANAYEGSGWLEGISRGAYKRTGDDLSWAGGLYALQKFQNIPVHVGGKTALELQGFGHYIQMSGREKVVLWKTPEVRLPSWFQDYSWQAEMVVRSATLFSKKVHALSISEVNQIELEISSAERAILEYMYEVPKHEGFDESSYLIEGLVSLRPRVLQELLEECNSVRVKRLFMYIAEYYNHSWFKRLDGSRIDLGKGKREIVKGTTLNKKYKIVVPELSKEDQ